ncbi:MAG: hypothetical protein R6V58_16130 [Planctomycetota bacterium]
MFTKTMTLVTAALVAGVTSLPALAGVELLIEDLDNCPAGSYTAYGGIDLGEVGTLPGWEVGGRYFTVSDAGGGDMVVQSTQNYGNICAGTKTTSDHHRRKPVYEAADALDMSRSTYVKLTATNPYEAPLYPSSAPTTKPVTEPIYMCYYDTSAGSTARVELGDLRDFGFPMAASSTASATYMLADYPAFDPADDPVYGFRMALNGYKTDPPRSTSKVHYVLNSIAYDVPEPQPVPEPGGLSLVGLALLGLRRKRR